MNNLQETFEGIIHRGEWMQLHPKQTETVCGPGCTIEATKPIAEALSRWVKELGIKSIVDLGCGDWNWMPGVDMNGASYDGYDIVRSLVERNRERYGSSRIAFHHADITSGGFNEADLVICKDVLNHLPLALILQTLGHVRAKAGYFFSLTYPGRSNKDDIKRVGDWQYWDLEVSPFNLGSPMDIVWSRESPPRLFALWKIRAKAGGVAGKKAG